MLKGKYTGYTKDETAEAVAALFEQKHGRRPAEILDTGAIWLAGPLNEGAATTPTRHEYTHKKGAAK